ncbi:hypothetical protein ACPOL_1325 [Acidisarcina polymorpha]|uniref:Uncharacterized protein n=1 Tax=Acidisarcina polymorpha TaxID=2211140 RepID=A0A2Z5FUW0_9BACT|nr:hypothetical protein ACPOL_1325 [Acidisarcina polymorpha]
MLLVKEQLFSRSEDKVTSTINTLQNPIGKLHFIPSPRSPLAEDKRSGRADPRTNRFAARCIKELDSPLLRKRRGI